MTTITSVSTSLQALDERSIEKAICESITGLDNELREINLKIHEHPEIKFAEFKAHDNIVNFLQPFGISVTPHAYGLETAFLAEYGSGEDGRVVTFCCEYDALPQIGHGCGHNLIATSTIAAFLGVVTAIRASGISARVRLLGTPAEEGGGGKIKLIEAGAFKGVDAALMVHPFPVSPHTKEWDGVAYGNCLAVLAFRATFEGRAAHAAFSPWLGANALDAATLTYSAVSMLRQQTRPTDIIGIIIEDGGASSNIISERTVMSGNVRAKTLKDSVELLERVHKCLQGAALATGCSLKIETIHEPYADLRSNKTLCSTFTDTMSRFQKNFKCDLDNIHDGPYGTDMGIYSLLLPSLVQLSLSTIAPGNVSYVCPSFHGTFHIETPAGVALHSAEFADAARTQEAHNAALEVAKGMAITGWKVLVDDDLASQMKEDFRQDELLR